MKRGEHSGMRIALIHNFYRSSAPSGEDEVVRGEQKLMEQGGMEVLPFFRHNDELPSGARGAITAALSNAWAFDAAKALREFLREHRPDVAHFHNTFPQISPAGYAVCREVGVPVVQTLHNYRMFCANGLLNRGGEACERCVGRAPLPALVHACYRESRIATVGMAMGIGLHRALGTYQRHVDRFIVLTEFARRKFLDHGLPEDRITVRGNGLPFDPGAGTGGGGYALYVGRLTAEKGVATLIKAWRKIPGRRLVIAGDGELRAKLEREACDLPVEFLGRISPSRVMELMKEAEMLVVPSECYEGFPRVVVEAFAAATPVVAADLGGLGEVVDESAGLKFPSGDASALARAVQTLWSDETLRARIARANRHRFETGLSPTASLTTLQDVYRLALSGNGSQRSGPLRA
jgi:glycosyltransferase involved in cell wall biosynthesis